MSAIDEAAPLPRSSSSASDSSSDGSGIAGRIEAAARHNLTYDISVYTAASFAKPSAAPRAISPDDGWRCSWCAARTTPERRSGPQGRRTLCNSCGLRWRKQRKQDRLAQGAPLTASPPLRSSRIDIANLLNP